MWNAWKCLPETCNRTQQFASLHWTTSSSLLSLKGLRDQKSWACSKIRTFQMHRLPVWSSQRIHFWNCSREEPIKKSPMVGNGPFTGPLVESTVNIHCCSLSWGKPCALSLFYYFLYFFCGNCSVCHHYDVSCAHVQSQKNLPQERPCISPGCEISKIVVDGCQDTSTACTNMKLVLEARHQPWHSVDIHASDTQIGDTHTGFMIQRQALRIDQ